MGTFTTTIEIGDPGARRWQQVDVLVDSGATFTMLPRSVLEDLDVRAQDKVPFELADGRSVELDVGETSVRIGGRVRTTLVIFGDSGVEPLLGAYTLEAFLLAVDPVNRRLVPVSGLLKCAGRTPPTVWSRSAPAGFAVCIRNGEYEADLIVGKVYCVLKPKPRDRPADIRVVDESGEDYLYPRQWFVAIDLPAKAKKALAGAH
jgi:aspartyl protease family protein